MISLFLDASVFYSACYSEAGASFEIFRQGLRRNVGLVVSDYVLQETERNLAGKAPKALVRFRNFRDISLSAVANPSKRQVRQAARYTELKDAPIVAAARKARVDFLVSLDRKHLVDRSGVAKRSRLKIVLPETAVKEIRRRQNDLL